MSRNKIDRIGERGVNNFGSEMIIVNSYMKFNDKHKRNYTYIDVSFPQYDWMAKNRQYIDFKKGRISCPYERSIYGVGYIGEGDYRVSENAKNTRVYDTWHSMLRRCYDPKYHKKYPTYTECTSSDEFHNFQNFGEWDKENYYKVKDERMCLDKDILVKGNKIYNPEMCIYVPETINLLFIKNDKNRGESLIGTSPANGKYRAYCSLINPKTGKSKYEYLGTYDTEIEAFQVYKYYKEKNIKVVADYFKSQIPTILYDALYEYEVEITD